MTTPTYTIEQIEAAFDKVAYYDNEWDGFIKILAPAPHSR
jgi:hypothetical protein